MTSGDAKQLRIVYLAPGTHNLHLMTVAARKKRAGAKPPNNSKNVVAQARGKSAVRREPFNLWEFIKGLLPAVAIFLVIKTFLFEAYRIPSASMEPAMLVGDFLFVNKLVYGPNIPWTDTNLPGYSHPGRGEIAIYKSPYQKDQPWDPTPTVVKRIVGIAGDTLHMRKGLLHVNGIAQRQGFGSVPDPYFVDGYDPNFEWQKEAGLKASRFGPAPAVPTHDNWGPFVVPQNHIFGLGDNRYQSKDARYYGFVPRKNVRGRPIFVYYSHDCANNGPVPLCFVSSVRWGRIGDQIR